MFHNSKYRLVLLAVILLSLLVSWGFISAYLLGSVADARAEKAGAVFSQLRQEQKYEFLGKLMDKEGFDSVSRMLELIETPSAGGITYRLGTYVYEKYGIKGIELCPESLILGCRAGILRAAMVNEGLGVIDSFDEACGFEQMGLGKSCGHGLGHGYTEVTNFNIAKSLEYCDELESYAQYPCYGGVFQEYLEFAPPEMVPQEDVWHPCIGLSDRYRSVCAFTLPDLWYIRYKFDDSESMERCLSSNDVTIKESCLLGVGFRIVKQNKGKSQEVLNRCSEVFQDKYRPLCYVAAANVIGVYKYPDWEKAVQTVCSELDGELYATCQKAAQTRTVFQTGEFLGEHTF